MAKTSGSVISKDDLVTRTILLPGAILFAAVIGRGVFDKIRSLIHVCFSMGREAPGIGAPAQSLRLDDRDAGGIVAVSLDPRDPHSHGAEFLAHAAHQLPLNRSDVHRDSEVHH